MKQARRDGLFQFSRLLWAGYISHGLHQWKAGLCWDSTSRSWILLGSSGLTNIPPPAPQLPHRPPCRPACTNRIYQPILWGLEMWEDGWNGELPPQHPSLFHVSVSLHLFRSPAATKHPPIRKQKSPFSFWVGGYHSHTATLGPTGGILTPSPHNTPCLLENREKTSSMDQEKDGWIQNWAYKLS